MKRNGKTIYCKKVMAPFMELAEELRDRISGGGFKPGDFVGTEVQLAEYHRLSRMTARRAVQQLVDEGIVERRPGLGIFVSEKKSAPVRIRFMAGNLLWIPAVRVAHAVQECAAGPGFEIEVFDACGKLAAFNDELAGLADGGFSGAIVMSQHDAAFSRAVVELAAAKFPLAVVDQTLTDIPVASVASDNRRGGWLAAREFISLGHRRIAFIGDLSADTTATRAKGVADACAEASIPPPSQYDIPGQRFADWEPMIRRRVEELLAASQLPTGIVCSCDAVARHVMRVLADCGVHVPDDMSVSGFDDDPIAEWTSPALTTVRQDFDAMGRMAFAMLERAIMRGTVAPEHADIPVTLVKRKSIGHLPGPRRLAS